MRNLSALFFLPELKIIVDQYVAQSYGDRVTDVKDLFFYYFKRIFEVSVSICDACVWLFPRDVN